VLTYFFGTKHEREIKRLRPIVNKINEYADSLKDISDNDLRNLTHKIKNEISKYVEEERRQIAEIKNRLLNDYSLSSSEVGELVKKMKKIEEDELKKLKEILDKYMIEVYGIVKETMRRFALKDYLEVKATDFDREIASKKKHVEIRGDTARWYSTWEVRGHPMKWNMIPYDVQIMGAIVLHEGKIAEMATGEGKTLVAVMPLFLNALAGKGVHLVTVNNYLSKRDCEWMGPIYEFHCLRCDCIDYSEPHSEERKKAYLADVTYGTNSEFGFDYLRDNMATRIEDVVQRGHYYAIIDEVDSILIDDARTPLIISGPATHSDHHLYSLYNPYVAQLVDVQKKTIIKFLNEGIAKIKEAQNASDSKEREKIMEEAGLCLYRCYRGFPKLKQLVRYMQEPEIAKLIRDTEAYYLRDNEKEMPLVDKELYFVIDEKHNSAELTDKGIEFLGNLTGNKELFILEDIGTRFSEIENMNISLEEKAKLKNDFISKYREKMTVLHAIQQLLKAYCLFEKDVDYVVINGSVKIVDENTGRILEGRRYSDGLHEAIEAKENVPVGSATQTYATITIQNYFRMYHKLAGMTGTAETEAAEFWEIYKLDVVVIPTNKPCIRIDEPDIVFKTKKDKFKAIIDKVEELHKIGRPVLLGTASIETSEIISRMLKMRGLPHQVLNAKYHEKEAEIIARAGEKGAITVATNMAGRGTDIKLGEGVAELGGLAVIGTEKHEARRIDKQLRGRAGRQGDPGSSVFYVSLEDDLMRIYGADKHIKLLEKYGGWKDDSGIQDKWLSKIIEHAQIKVEQNNFAIRKRNLEFDDVLNKQREEIYARRRNALSGLRISLDIIEAMEVIVKNLVNSTLETKNFSDLFIDYFTIFGVEPPISERDIVRLRSDEIIKMLYEKAVKTYQIRQTEIINISLPIMKEIHQKGNIEVVGVPIALPEGILNLPINVNKAIETSGKEIVRSLERFVSIITIDDEWRKHLRELDNLRYEVYQAVFEQKDPLLVYKLEATNLFRQLIDRINKRIITMLMHARVMTPDEVQKIINQQRRVSIENESQKLREYKSDEDIISAIKNQVARRQAEEMHAPGMGSHAGSMDYSVATVRRQFPKVGRNDPCPCGSGKKYKHCHGK